jgi:hypothetical protein
MTRTWIVLAGLASVAVGLVPPALAQDAETADGTRQVVFSFGGWGLGSYGGGIGLRYFVADNVAIRSGLDVGIDDHSEDVEAHYPEELDVYTSGYDARTVRLSFLAERYVGGLRNLKPFLTLGLAYRFEDGGYDFTSVSYGDSATAYYSTDSYTRTEHAVSLVGGFGLQWYFTDRISLGGEYNVIVAHSWVDATDRYVYYREGEIEVDTYARNAQETNIDIEAGNLLLSVRF